MSSDKLSIYMKQFVPLSRVAVNLFLPSYSDYSRIMSLPGSVNLNELPPVENLLATRSQVEKDLQLLTESFSQLKGAQANFATSIQSLESLNGSGTVTVTCNCHLCFCRGEKSARAAY